MNRPEKHQIDEAAQRILRNALPHDWVLRKKDPDYAIDYEIEIVANEKLTGLCVATQLKGTKTLKLKRGFVTFSIKTHHLKYYVDKRREPVFLVVVDVTTATGYWLFLQQYALQDLAGKNWRSQAKISVRVPASQTLQDVEGLRHAAEEADKFMAGARPGGVTAALDGERRRIESLDPRFRARSDVIGGKIRWELQPVEPVECTFFFKGESEKTHHMLSDLIGRGLPVQVNPADIEVVGSDLIAYAVQKSLFIQSVRLLQGSIRLLAVDADGTEVSRIDHIPAQMEGGTSEVRIEAALPRSPFRAKLTLKNIGDAVPVPPPGWTISFAVSEWAGQQLLYLSYFDQIASFLRAVDAGHAMQLEIQIDGNRVCALSSNPSPSQLVRLRELAAFVAIIGRAREVAKKGGINPTFPKDFTAELAEAVDELHWALFSAGAPLPAKGMVITTVSNRSAVQRLLEQPPDDGCTGALRLERENEPIDFMGERFCPGALIYEMTHFGLATPLDELRKQLESSNVDEFELKWVGAAEAVRTVSQKPST
jgi:hypothetical protein